MATGKDRSSRESRERTRQYEARQTFHRGQSRRRSRDNLIAGIVGGVVILGVIGGQTAYFTLGPGVPVPEPTESPSSTIAPTEGATDAPTDAPAESATPEPTVTP